MNNLMRCRDPAFTLLLCANVDAVAAVAGAYGLSVFNQFVDDVAVDGYNYTGYVYATFVLGALAITLTAATLPIMMCIPTALIKISDLMMLVYSGVWMGKMILVGSIIGTIIVVSAPPPHHPTITPTTMTDDALTTPPPPPCPQTNERLHDRQSSPPSP
jgi:hypothetical protein